MNSVGVSAAVNRLWLPRLALSQCLRAVISRDTRGLVLAPLQRMNQFPVSALCTLSWWFEGRAELVDVHCQQPETAPRQPLQGQFVFGGPQTRPSASWNPGPVHAMMVALLPDAVQAMTGIDPAAYVNRLVDAHTVLPAPWLGLCEAVQAARDDDARVLMIQDFLEPTWRQARPDAGQVLLSFRDWTQGLALRAYASGSARSLRQAERRVRQWAGLPLRELRVHSRAEQAYFNAMHAARHGDMVWAQRALEDGFADQPHMCRESRRVTGFTPAQLHDKVFHDEAFWVYRLWEHAQAPARLD